MDRIVIFEGRTLMDFMERLRDIVDPQQPGVYLIRVALDSEGMKLKVNDQSWSPPLGYVRNVEFEPPSPSFVDPLNLMPRMRVEAVRWPQKPS